MADVPHLGFVKRVGTTHEAHFVVFITVQNLVGIDAVVFSERELTFTFAICYRPSVCRLSVFSIDTKISDDTHGINIL